MNAGLVECVRAGYAVSDIVSSRRFIMNGQVIIGGMVYVIFALPLGILFIFASIAFLRLLDRSMDHIREFKRNNAAYALFAGSVVFSTGWIVSSVIAPTITGLSLLLRSPAVRVVDVARFGMTTLLQLLVAGGLAFGLIFAGIRVFMKLTGSIREMKEIGRNNVSLGILSAVIIVLLALFVQPGIRIILDGMVSYPPFVPGR